MITVVLDFGFQRIDGRPNFRSVVIVTKALPKGDGIGLGVKAVLGEIAIFELLIGQLIGNQTRKAKAAFVQIRLH
jgi:hypothetical protein